MNRGTPMIFIGDCIAFEWGCLNLTGSFYLLDLYSEVLLLA
jgi:hypothetical protein